MKTTQVLCFCLGMILSSPALVHAQVEVEKVEVREGKLKKLGRWILTPIACAPGALIVATAAVVETIPFANYAVMGLSGADEQDDWESFNPNGLGAGVQAGMLLVTASGETLYETGRVLSGNEKAGEFKVTKTLSDDFYLGTRTTAEAMFKGNSVCARVRKAPKKKTTSFPPSVVEDVAYEHGLEIEE